MVRRFPGGKLVKCGLADLRVQRLGLLFVLSLPCMRSLGLLYLDWSWPGTFARGVDFLRTVGCDDRGLLQVP